MKIAVTGHTRGIGKAIYAKLSSSHTVRGYSITEGYDIANEHIRKKILQDISNFDVFVNNAFHKTGQTKLLQDCIELWDGAKEKKLIIHINSKSIYMKQEVDRILDNKDGDDVHVIDYIKSKQEQQSIINEARSKVNPSIINILLGPVETDLANVLRCRKLDIIDVANAVAFGIDNKDNMLLQEITIDVPNQPWSQIFLK